MNDGQRYRRRKPNMMSGDDEIGNNLKPHPRNKAPPEAFRKPRKLSQHQHRPKPRPKYTTSSSSSSWNLIQVLMGICACLANGFLIVYFVWMWYSNGMKLPSLHLQEDAELVDLPNHYHKVEKMWRYDRQQFHKWNTATIDDESSSSDPPPPIIVVGLPKAGTSSIFEFFSCHGVYAQHWYCCGPQRSAELPGLNAGPRFGPSYMSHCLLENLQEQARQNKNNNPQFDSKWNHSILDGCGDYDVYTEMNGPYLPPTLPPDIKQEQQQDDPFHSSKGIFLPQHYHLEELHAAVPTATWILNVRSVDDWIRSVANVPARSLVERLQYEVLVRHANENEATGKYQQYNNLIIPMNVDSNKAKRKSSSFGFGSLRGEKNKKKSNNASSIPRWQQEEGFLRDFWYDHIQRVQTFSQTHGHRLIIVNISDANAGVQLGMDLEWFVDGGVGASSDHHHQQRKMNNNNTRVVKPRRVSLSKAKACWKRYNAAEYHHGYNN